MSWRADFYRAGIFLHHMKTQPLRFWNFIIKARKMGIATSSQKSKTVRPVIYNYWFVCQRGVYKESPIFLLSWRHESRYAKPISGGLGLVINLCFQPLQHQNICQRECKQSPSLLQYSTPLDTNCYVV